jgi:hypothetical protein
MRCMSSLRLIGYWRSEYDSTPWPDPHDFVDDTWPAATRELVVAYLVRGRTLQQYRGLSLCRFCGLKVGSKELTDRMYCWPEGLAHYVAAHNVRLPDEFVTHVESSADSLEVDLPPEFDHLGQRLRGGGYDDEYQTDCEASNAIFREHTLMGKPLDPSPPNWLNADITDDWWMEQPGSAP